MGNISALSDLDDEVGIEVCNLNLEAYGVPGTSYSIRHALYECNTSRGIYLLQAWLHSYYASTGIYIEDEATSRRLSLQQQ